MIPGASFADRAATAAGERRVIHAIKLATFRKVEQRATALSELRDPEALRDMAATIKAHTLSRLPDYLEQFSGAVEHRGGQVHFAVDARSAAELIVSIAERSGGKLAVKSKSMTSEEIQLNDALESACVRVVETDLGEFIVQLDRDTPSHIVTPIIHKDRAQVAATMQRELGCEYTEDPVELTRIARAHLREVFRTCDIGITGVNFGIAETGTICICTNEGNGRMTSTRPRVHIALMGIEKLIPRLQDLPVFLKLLARSSTGQALTVYTSLITGPKRADDADGPDELHVILLDNGRAALLGSEFEDVLRCIRCGACLNACPVYRNVGGHAYASVYPGPIGALVTPLMTANDPHGELPGASSLCGACEAACPVRIDIPKLLVRLRARFAGHFGTEKRQRFAIWRFLMMRPALYRAAQWLLRRLPASRAPGDGASAIAWIRAGFGPLRAWTESRDLPRPVESFRQRWQRTLRDES